MVNYVRERRRKIQGISEIRTDITFYNEYFTRCCIDGVRGGDQPQYKDMGSYFREEDCLWFIMKWWWMLFPAMKPYKVFDFLLCFVLYHDDKVYYSEIRMGRRLFKTNTYKKIHNTKRANVFTKIFYKHFLWFIIKNHLIFTHYQSIILCST